MAILAAKIGYVVRHSFFSTDTATTEIYTLSLHDALPISIVLLTTWISPVRLIDSAAMPGASLPLRSEEHTSELQSQFHLVCRLLLEKKKIILLAPVFICDITQTAVTPPTSFHYLYWPPTH